MQKSDPLWFEHLSSALRPSLRLFCFPYAGGSSQVFRKWQRHFPPEVDICLVHLPGRGKRIGEPPLTRLKPLVEEIADVIHGNLQPAFALFGHSMGALISFELSRELRRRYGITPRQLFLSGHRAPHVTRTGPPTFNLPHDDFMAELKRLNGTPWGLLDNAETRELFLPIIRADFEMVDTYQYLPEEPLSCPFTIYSGLQDTKIQIGRLRAWEELTSGSCKIRTFPGDHFFIHSCEMEFVNALQRDVLSVLHDSIARRPG
ncbi:MAG: thioesterase domain-containing protein [Candidatus Sulfotelmatobacter sp.]